MFTQLAQNIQEKLKKLYTSEELKIIENGFWVEKRPTTFRVNTLKASNEEIENVLQEKNITFSKIPYLSNGYKLLEAREKDLWDLDIFKSWKIYLQWITSQLIGEIIVKDIEKKDIKVLDLTAAPGGKTSHISAILGNNWEIIANELQMVRREKLKFTIERQWCTNVEIIAWDANNLKNKFEKEYFDVIIADVPCSAEWRINFHNEKSYKFLEKPGVNKKNYTLQKEILTNNIDLLKNDWYIIYSTCTLDALENEWILHLLVSNFKNLKIQDISEYFTQNDIQKITKNGVKSYENYIFNNEVQKAVRILPSTDTEWFFIAKLKKVWIY